MSCHEGTHRTRNSVESREEPSSSSKNNETVVSRGSLVDKGRIEMATFFMSSRTRRCRSLHLGLHCAY